MDSLSDVHSLVSSSDEVKSANTAKKPSELCRMTRRRLALGSACMLAACRRVPGKQLSFELDVQSTTSSLFLRRRLTSSMLVMDDTNRPIRRYT